MSDEPISARVARAKGCSPRQDTSVDYPFWFCPCGKGRGHRSDEGYPFLVSASSEQWLTPAASFALLAEMVDANMMPWVRRDSDYCYDFGLPGSGSGDAPTLAEAIALAWLAFDEARRQG